MWGAFATLIHNGDLIRKAEKTLQDMAASDHCYLYLVNPDGTRVRIMPGCRIEDYEMIPIVREETQ